MPISVDTYRAEVARAAIDEGASIINDISGLRYDPALADVVATVRAALVLMHMRGRPKTMYAEAVYDDVDRGSHRGAAATAWRVAAAAGVPLERLIVDPGVGFAKRPGDSYGVLARLSALAEALDRPMLVGPSRKSFMREALGGPAAPERDWGTAAAVTAAVLAGAHIVRVHAVSGDGAGRESGGGNPEARRMTWLTAVLRRPPISWWDIADIAWCRSSSTSC